MTFGETHLQRYLGKYKRLENTVPTYCVCGCEIIMCLLEKKLYELVNCHKQSIYVRVDEVVPA